MNDMNGDGVRNDERFYADDFPLKLGIVYKKRYSSLFNLFFSPLCNCAKICSSSCMSKMSDNTFAGCDLSHEIAQDRTMFSTETDTLKMSWQWAPGIVTEARVKS